MRDTLAGGGGFGQAVCEISTTQIGSKLNNTGRISNNMTRRVVSCQLYKGLYPRSY